MTAPLFIGLLALQISFSEKPVKKAAPKAEIVHLANVWNLAPHSAFTDLLWYQERWLLAFREGRTHASEDGAIRILTSTDGDRWHTAALLKYPVADLRDPKLTVTPQGKVMLTAAGAMHASDAKHKMFAWFSTNGNSWSEPVLIGEPDMWLWRVHWYHDKAYGFGYSTGEQPHVLRSYTSSDGEKFRVLNPAVIEGDYANESAWVFLPDDSALCLLRRDPKPALLGKSRPPYRAWEWTELNARVGGPDMVLLDDGRLVAAVRLYDGKVRTSLVWVHPEEGRIEEFLTLPSGGDTSYAGLVFHDGLLWVSYYSSHEDRTSIYLAKVKLP